MPTPDQPLLRVFFAHPKNWTDEQIDRETNALAELFTAGVTAAARMKGKPPPRVVVISGRDDYKRAAKRAGGWKPWARSVAGPAIDGQPRFHRIVCPEEYVGRATADIVRDAITNDRPVFLLDKGRLRRITEVRTVNPDSWVNGWRLIAAP